MGNFLTVPQSTIFKRPDCVPQYVFPLNYKVLFPCLPLLAESDNCVYEATWDFKLP